MTVTNRFEGSWARLLAVFAMAALLLSLVPTLAGTANADHAHTSNETERLRNETQRDRFGTAVDIAHRAFPDGTDTVVLARAEIFADALAGSLAAGTLDAPILLTTGSSLHPTTAAAIDHLFEGRNDTTVVLLGGSAAISANTETQVGARDSVDDVVRIEGKNRFDTARNIAHFAASHGLPQNAPVDNVGTTQTEDDTAPQRTAIVATGEAFADALAAGPLAYGGSYPLLLTARDTLSGETEDALTDLEIDRVWLAGGVNAVSEATENQIEALGIETLRVNVPGGDRTHTAVEFAELTRAVLYDNDGADRHLAVATGLDANGGVDALALAPLAARTQSDLVITRGVTFAPGSAVNGVVQPLAFIQEHCEFFGAPETPILLAGGPQAIAATAEQQIKDAAICGNFVPAGALSVGPDATNPISADPAENTHTVTVSGENSAGDAAEGAVVQVEVYTDATPPASGDGLYREGTTVFVLAETATVTLGEDGTAPFEYQLDGTDEREDRIVACALPNLEPEPAAGEEDTREDRSCTTETGDLPEDATYGQDVAEKSWVAATATFDLALTSAQEVGDNTADADDAITGTARVLTDTDTNTICWRIEMAPESTTDPGAYTVAHLHEAPAGQAGAPVVDFGTFAEDSLTLSGCATPTPAEFDVSDVETTPADYYVNVHSEVFPGGAARAQLS